MHLQLLLDPLVRTLSMQEHPYQQYHLLLRLQEEEEDPMWQQLLGMVRYQSTDQYQNHNQRYGRISQQIKDKDREMSLVLHRLLCND